MRSPGKQRPPCIGCKETEHTVSVTVRIMRKGFSVHSAVLPICPECLKKKEYAFHLSLAAQQALLKMGTPSEAEV